MNSMIEKEEFLVSNSLRACNSIIVVSFGLQAKNRAHCERRKSLRNDCKISRSQPQKFDLDFHSTSTTSKGLTENSKKMSWDNPVFPIDTKNTIGFFVQFFLS